MQKQLEPIINKMSKELGVPYDICVQAYMSQWHFILEKINALDIKGMTIEEFRAAKKNFNLPSIGKLCITEKRFIAVNKQYEYLRKRRNQNVQNQEGAPNVQSGGDNEEQV